MIEFITQLKSLGSLSLDLFWFPILIWTALAAAAVVIFKIIPAVPAAYQYHGRVAILWALPAGILGSWLLHLYSTVMAAPASTFTAKIFVVQNPITVTATANPGTINWSEPMLWAGLFTLLALLVAFAGIFRLIKNFVSLQLFTRELKIQPKTSPALSDQNRYLLSHECPNTDVVFSESVTIPCTFGWRQKYIVLPQSIRNEPEKLNMALRHELMHIRQHDYLLNTTLQGIKSLFYFHPLVHLLVKKAGEYRELYCDQSVLADPAISQKKYAELLFELAPQSIVRTSAAVNMAVYPSTLKKRIQTMKTQYPSPPSMKKSLILMLVTGLLFTGFIACSDIEEGGITNSEVQEVQANADKAPADKQPLFLIEGERIDDAEINKNGKGSIIPNLKPKYIKSINVLKGQQAIDKYGEAGKNGVVDITLIDEVDKEKVFSDLRTSPPPSPKKPENEDHYIQVDNPPEIVGGYQVIINDVTYPKTCKDAGIEGRVVVSFIVNKQGKAEDPQIIRGIGGGCDEEALRVVKQANFEPGTQDGQPVRVQMSLPILFRLS